MPQALSFRAKGGTVALICLIAGCAVWVLFSGMGSGTDWAADFGAAFRRPTGAPQLISIKSLPSSDGEMCEWDTIRPVSAEPQERFQARAAASSPAGAGARSSNDADRSPERVIRDTYPTYSAIALDPKSGEVFLEDENLYGIKVFNRTDNTAPNAAFTEPKRILGGLKTKLEFNCGMYIDPQNGDVYSVANDTGDDMVVFPHDAKGNVEPMRELKIPHGSYGIAVDEGAAELYLTVEHNNAVFVFEKKASGNAQPLRSLSGEQTRLEDPHGIAIDIKNNWMFVSNHGNAKNRRVPGSGKFAPPSITVYPLKASGDTAPLRVISGSRTQLNWPAAMYLDPEHGELFVANDSGDSILVFRETDSGDVAPARIIKGSKTGLKNPTGIYLDLKNQELWASNMGNHSATVFARTADGNTAPLRTIRSAPAGKLALAIGNPGGAGYDSKRDEILVPN
jgi:DNA-binding beta-propeller fold protein YncE